MASKVDETRIRIWNMCFEIIFVKIVWCVLKRCLEIQLVRDQWQVTAKSFLFDKWLQSHSFLWCLESKLRRKKLQSKLKRKNIYNGPMISTNDIFIAIALLMVKFQLSSICFVLWLCSHQVCVLSCDFAVIKCVFCLVTLQSSSVCFSFGSAVISFKTPSLQAQLFVPFCSAIWYQNFRVFS